MKFIPSVETDVCDGNCMSLLWKGSTVSNTKGTGSLIKEAKYNLMQGLYRLVVFGSRTNTYCTALVLASSGMAIGVINAIQNKYVQQFAVEVISVGVAPIIRTHTHHNNKGL